MTKSPLIILLKVLNTVALIFIAFAVFRHVFYLYNYNEGCAKSSNVENFVETLDLPKEQMFVTTDGSTITPFKFDGTGTLPEIDVQAGGSICIGTGTSASCIKQKDIPIRGSGNITRFNEGSAYSRSSLLVIPDTFIGTLDVIGDVGNRTTVYIESYPGGRFYFINIQQIDAKLSNNSMDKINVFFDGGRNVYMQNTGAGWNYKVFWTLQSL
jgi:hypothetical protein